MPQLFSTYGVDYNNISRISNLNYNLNYDILNSNWLNGAPYSCWTSTNSTANQTNIHIGKGNKNDKIKITHLLETQYIAGTKYIWKIPLLLNPINLNIPFRMNLTLYNYYSSGFGIGGK